MEYKNIYIVNPNLREEHTCCAQGKNYTGPPGDFAPEMYKRAHKNQNIAPENCHRLQCKSLFNVADLEMECEK